MSSLRKTSVKSPAGSKIALIAGAGLLALASFTFTSGNAAERAVRIPPPVAGMSTADAKSERETVVFAGGCFWGVQGVFQHTKGVIDAVSGYAGGKRKTPTYEEVSTGSTGHAESVQVTFDPRQVSYGQLLQIYFSVIHDPTELNRQGPDAGTQYRSAVFYSTDAQKATTEAYISQLDQAKAFSGKIVTQVAPLASNAFYAAETYHQNYATLHPDSGYIATFDLPKIAALKSMYPQTYREQPVLVSVK